MHSQSVSQKTKNKFNRDKKKKKKIYPSKKPKLSPKKPKFFEKKHKNQQVVTQIKKKHVASTIKTTKILTLTDF